jgi:uncharacterized membrane protein YqjE
MNFNMTNVPRFMTRELEKMKEYLTPLLKKNVKLSFTSRILIAISVMNFIFIFVSGQWNNTSTVTLIIYAVLGAVGFALSKESKFINKEIIKKTEEYVVNRISKSRFLSDVKKTRFQKAVKEQPINAMNVFVEFMNEEEQAKKQMLEQ